MSEETLKAAASLMRERAKAAHIADGLDPSFALAVADWLDAMHGHFAAEALYDFPGSCLPHEAKALAVATAYLSAAVPVSLADGTEAAS